jgi:hypothetical protein
MHRGIQEFVQTVTLRGPALGVVLNPPASGADLSHLEHLIGSPLPADLRVLLQRFNGAVLPSGTLLGVGAPVGQTTIEATMKELAERMECSFLDPELPLPFHRNAEGALLAFDRTGGPVADTWPIIDYFVETGEVRLVYRTLDGWCRAMVAEWTSDDYFDDFTLDKYLRAGLRHAAIEPDVASAHATVAHALKRAGRPEEALAAYLRAARCVPPLPWCDWEALKIAVMIRDDASALEAATRLSKRAPPERWVLRETTPGRVADLIAQVAQRASDPAPWLRLLDLLAEQVHDADDREQVTGVRRALATGQPLPPSRPSRASVARVFADPERWWADVQQGYAEGRIRDEDVLLDPTFAPIRATRDLGALLRIRREF